VNNSSNGAGNVLAGDDDSLIAPRHVPGWQPGPKISYTPRRINRVARAVEDGVRGWKHRGTRHSPYSGTVPPQGLLPGEVRRRLNFPSLADIHPPMMRQLKFEASIWLTVRRLLEFFAAVIFWRLGTLLDGLRGRNTVERRARRLREIIEWKGGTAIKLGQQAAMRIDLLPYAYTLELSKMLDSVPAFPTEEAVERIEKSLGKRLDEVFDRFDPKPIGSASVACVYQAYLKTGERVAIKVRRPKIGEQFVADCTGLAVMLRILELLTIIRPGLSSNFLYEFRAMMLEELDFVKEARYTELFRRRALKNLKDVSAPKVYFECSSEEVLVTEFMAGIWLRELLAAIEQKDTEALELLREYNIDPHVIAQRLIRTNQYGVFENLLFHADPHPSNVVVQPNNRVVFIDFGSCGAYTTRERNNWRQLNYYHRREDIGRMVQAALAVLEPLPPIDIDEFSKRLEVVFWQDLYAFKSKHAEWWERTSAKVWIGFLALAREYGMSLNLNTLRMIRSTLLYETVAARLYPNISAYREHQVYSRKAGKRAKKRVQNRIAKWIFQGPSNRDYLQIEEFMGMGNRALYLAQRYMDTPPFRFSMLVNKATYAVSILVQTVIWAVFGMMLGTCILVGYRLIFIPDYKFTNVNFWTGALDLFSTLPFQLVLGIVFLLSVRRILFRFFDMDIHDNTSGLS
jgi:predicted unusual protein kinase regulating ubiquinone biosynthesis (AarF/ABC1/UbiB family)